MHRILRNLLALSALALLAACSSTPDDGAPTVVVTTSILGDVVANLTGGTVEVVTIMPVGVDPHDFRASARQAHEIRSADALIVNGGGFEEGLVDVIDGADADGVPIFVALDAVDTIEFGSASHDEHGLEDEGGLEDGDDHEGADPHFFTDPTRMASAVGAISEFVIATVEGVDADAIRAATVDYRAELEALDSDVAAMTAMVPADKRILVTNHEVFGYFADRYGFEIVGAVVPGGSTTDTASAGTLADLAEIIAREGVPAIFADTSSSDDLVQTLAAEVGNVAVVALYSESLGAADSDGATYVGMVRSNAERITAALEG